jgi:hypothetical protein
MKEKSTLITKDFATQLRDILSNPNKATRLLLLLLIISACTPQSENSNAGSDTQPATAPALATSEVMGTPQAPTSEAIQNHEVVTTRDGGEIHFEREGELIKVYYSGIIATCRFTYLTESDNPETLNEKQKHELLISRGEGEENCEIKTADAPLEFKVPEWQGDHFGSPVVQVFIMLRTEGGWEKAEMIDVTRYFLTNPDPETEVSRAIQNKIGTRFGGQESVIVRKIPTRRFTPAHARFNQF